MASTILIYGPSGCGKTQNAQMFLKAFDCTSVIDDWRSGSAPVVEGGLHLTQTVRLSYADLEKFDLIYRFDEAVQQAGFIETLQHAGVI